jgi:hypothetical protein
MIGRPVVAQPQSPTMTDGEWLTPEIWRMVSKGVSEAQAGQVSVPLSLTAKHRALIRSVTLLCDDEAI